MFYQYAFCSYLHVFEDIDNIYNIVLFSQYTIYPNLAKYPNTHRRKSSQTKQI